MNDEAFAHLMESIKEAGEIKRSVRKLGRVFEFGPPRDPNVVDNNLSRGGIDNE
jgi:hypothetical protein